MKVVLMFNKDIINIQKKSLFILNKLKGCSNIEVETVESLLELKKIKSDFDVYVLITNSIKEVILCKRKIRNRRKILILTENANANFIMRSIDFTKNLLYLNVAFDVILQKIHSICLENNKL